MIKEKLTQNGFTGKTWMKVISEKIDAKDQDIYHVHFENGSRTKTSHAQWKSGFDCDKRKRQS